MATLKDVALHAGVSVTTVSNFINNKKKLKDETRHNILAAIQATGYRHNALAASLKKSASSLKSIGIISIVDQNPFFSELFFKLENECFKQDFTVISCFRHEDKEDLHTYINLMSGRVDGIILISLKRDKIENVIKHIHAIPVVAIAFDIGDVMSLCGGTEFNLHNQTGGYIAGRFIASKGHKKIACVTGPKGLKTTADRIAGLKKALAEFNLPDDAVDYIAGDYTYQSGVDAMYQLFSSATLPTAIICHNDLMAIGVQNAANELGLKIPRELSVMGYDDIEMSKLSFPSLSTVKISLDEMACQALAGLGMKMTAPGKKAVISVTPSLVVRGSVSEPITFGQ
ncbi:LacI family DNA-binding transcriptional regulator [Pseudomonas lundensis]|uniref:LacI family DNA-binding transcriptional regulator n=1 Tax=Serratia proteamaculans TaxID=28151 RepID=UPI002981FEEA|nr:LacI family DNA-binding transcriptional regulator [Serratia proteamaculans]MDW5498460.1 LacI family DNA-binding transcriptional regulator [Serratia proteamaculans]MDW5503520.1 LacI family DNA-binding transcriptional regulator [Pseudomonas lundensis]